MTAVKDVESCIWQNWSYGLLKRVGYIRVHRSLCTSLSSEPKSLERFWNRRHAD